MQWTATLSHPLRGLHRLLADALRSRAANGESTGYAGLDALLPQRGWPRRAPTKLLGAHLLAVRGRWKQVEGVRHLIAWDLSDPSCMNVSERESRTRD